MEERTVDFAILGAGGLGRSMVRLLQHKPQLRLVAICDSTGFAANPQGLQLSDEVLDKARAVPDFPGGRVSSDPIASVASFLVTHRSPLTTQSVFTALPNLPNSFIPDVARRFAERGFSGVMVDALKRTTAVDMMLDLGPLFEQAGITYLTGAGATPGLLTAAAALAAQSFVEVEKVEIYFGVGIANWEAYRATIREDIAHLPNFDVEKAKALSDEEVARLLDERNGTLELVEMEHADDIMLELAGVCPRERVTVGGIVDTRHARKPVSTNVKVQGWTFEGKRSCHTFTLGDETSMAANVCGPALGYLNAGLWLNDRGLHGVFHAAELMPRFSVPEQPAKRLDQKLARAQQA